MLRENDIPVSGKYCGFNLNRDVLEKMINNIDKWKLTMGPRGVQLALSLYKPVQALLNAAQSCIQESYAEPALKKRALDALQDSKRAIDVACKTLSLDLEDGLKQNHLHFTTEIDIYGPIAKEMKEVYARAQDQREVGTGEGLYGRQRKTLRKYMVDPSKADRVRPWIKELTPTMETLENDIVREQKDIWSTHCDTFIAEVNTQLLTFHKITEDLLKNAAYMIREHRNVRLLLKKLLVDFDKSLARFRAASLAWNYSPSGRRPSWIAVTGTSGLSLPLLAQPRLRQIRRPL
jgi:hypothetical protein